MFMAMTADNHISGCNTARYGYTGVGIYPNLAGYRVMEPCAKEAIDKVLK
jgi:hypothetical protein